MNDDLVLSLHHVTSGYHEGGRFRKGSYHEVLHDVSFDVRHGEIRAVSNLSQRLSEVHRLGFTRCIIPKQGTGTLEGPSGLELIRVRNIREAIEFTL